MPSNTLTTEIEIAASPETVRSVFLDFQRYKDWHQTSAIVPSVSDKQAVNLAPGDRIKVDLKGTVIHPTVVENSPNSFQWRGNLYGLLVGTHQFHFTPSQKTQGATTLVHKEDFSGLLALLFSPGSGMTNQTAGNFESFNKDIKVAAERVAITV
ncbi:hypothetical protein BGZ63DRAFT_455619 [Mariannaea sp. PMI_226]|nr:hypothetical protein BGZ63DRAFT_455619 [Mariannaea sp. PMI_226]